MRATYFKFSGKNRVVLSTEKEGIIFATILAIIFLKWYVAVVNNIFWRVGDDCLRHLSLVNLIMKYGRVNYFHQDGTPTACLYYPPGFHILISQLSIISGIKASVIINVLSLIFFVLFVMMMFVIGRIILKDAKRAIVLPFIAAVVSLVVFPVPMNMCTCIFFPLLIYLCLRHISKGERKNGLLVSVVTVSLVLTHFSYAVFLIVITIAMILSNIFVDDKKIKGNFLNIWIITIISSFIGFLLYNPLTPDLVTSIKSITVWWLYSSFIPVSFVWDHPKLVIIGILLVSVITYLVTKKTLIKNSINRGISKFISKLFSVIVSIDIVLLAIFIFSSVALLFMQYIMVYLVEPSIPFFARKIAFSSISSLIGFGKSALSAFISPNIGFSILTILALLKIRKKIREGSFWDENNILLFSFIVPFISLMCLALFNNSFLTNSSFGGRMPSYAFLSIIFFASYVLSDFVKFSNVKKILLVACAIVIVASSTLQPIFSTFGSDYNKGIIWLTENTPIRVDTRLKRKDIGGVTYDQQCYYHISIVPKLYRFKMRNLQIYASLLKNNSGEYAPLLSLELNGYKKHLYLSSMKWKPIASEKESDNKIYANDEITFWHKNR